MTPEEAKLLCRVFVDTIQQETETTKKVMRAVPEGKKAYKPESKSMSAQELAWHIGQFTMTDPPAAPPTIGAIVSWYETNHRERVNKLKNLPADKLMKPISLFAGMELPAVAYLNLLNLHSSHHRGQLSSYLRPMGSKVPAIYGGSADEPMQH